MKKFLSLLIIIGLLICFFVFMLKAFVNKPIFDTEDRINVYYDGVRDNQYNHVFINDQIYISADYLMSVDLLDHYWDKEYNKISFYNNFNYENIFYNDNKALYNNVSYNLTDIFYIDDNKLYFSLEFLKDHFIDRIYADIEENKIIIEENTTEYAIIKNTNLKTEPSNLHDTIIRLNKGDHIYIYNYEYKGWVLARTSDNKIGYIKLEHLKPAAKIKYKKYTVVNKKKEIKMAWDLITQPIENFEPFYLPDTIDIIAPTWYELTDNDAFFHDLSNKEYYNYTKGSGKEIWAVFTNGFDPELTSNLLNDGYKRSKIVDKIIEITKNNNFDGINIDFENIYLNDKNVYAAFIKELYCKSLKEDIILSVDITVLSKSENWSLCFDRKAIGKFSDYIMLMAYDENVSDSVGSVASLPWVEKGVSNLLEYAYPEKIVLCVPLYTRLWEIYNDGNGEKFKSTALRIPSAVDKIKELGITFKYDDVTKQNYGEKKIDNVVYKIWNEDTTSLNNRLSIIKKYDLTGIAAWALSYGNDVMWNLLE